MKDRVFRVTIIFLTILLPGCATFYSGSHDTIHIASLPQNAKVEINGKYVGETPLTLEMKRSISKKQVTLIKEGYKRKTFQLKKRLHPLAIVDIPTILGGLIDVWSGAITPYSQKYYEQELKSGQNPTEKINKQSFYNTEDNFYLITFKHDTIYCEPDIWDEWGRVFYTPINGRRQSMSNNDVAAFKQTDSRSWALLNLNKHHHYNKIYEAHPFWPEKKPNKYTYMQLCIKDTAYKLLVVYFATGVNDDGEFRKFMGFEGLGYYIFKGDEFVAHLSKVDFVDGLKKYFPGCVEFIRQIEEEKTSYKDLYSLINKYKMEHGDAFYVKPLNKKEVK